MIYFSFRNDSTCYSLNLFNSSSADLHVGEACRVNTIISPDESEIGSLVSGHFRVFQSLAKISAIDWIPRKQRVLVMCLLDWEKGCPESWQSVIYGCHCEVVCREINLGICREGFHG